MNKIDKRNRFDEEVFSYQATKDRKVFIFWNGQRAKTLSGVEAERFLQKVDDLDNKE